MPHGKTLLLALVAATILLTAGCGQDETSRDDLPPVAPVWVPRSADNVYPQRGIRPQPGNSQQYHLRLEWFANPEPDVLGYRIYRVAENLDPARRYPLIDLEVGVDIPEGAAQYFWVDQGDSTGGFGPGNLLAPLERQPRGYRWQILAYDQEGLRSEDSPLLYYHMIYNPNDIQVTRAAANRYTLTWHYPFPLEMNVAYYMVRVYSQAWGPDSVAWYGTALIWGEQGTVNMDFSDLAAPMTSDCTYVCQLNVISNRSVNGQSADSLSGAAVYTLFTYRN